MESLFVKKLDTGIHNLRIIKDASFLGNLLERLLMTYVNGL